MPTIAKLGNLIIKIHYIEDEHNPPHFHAYCGGSEAIVDINKSSFVVGYLPRPIMKIVIEFAKQNKKILLKMWKSQKFTKLEIKEKNYA